MDGIEFLIVEIWCLLKHIIDLHDFNCYITIMIKLRRLQEVPVKGNFTIYCEDHEQFIKLQTLFTTSAEYVVFRNIPEILNNKSTYVCTFIPVYDSKDTRTKFIIKYESLMELLKLRDIFRIRGAKFDVYLLAKRKMGEFDTFFSEELLKQFKDLTISKIRK